MTCKCENCSCGKNNVTELNRYINDKNGNHVGYLTLEIDNKSKEVKIGWSFCDLRYDTFNKRIARSFAKEYAHEIFNDVEEVLAKIPYKRREQFKSLIDEYRGKYALTYAKFPNWVCSL